MADREKNSPLSTGNANFNFYLNRQGAQGKQGEKGDEGFSPYITQGKDTLSEYTMIVTNENGSFETPNLREHKEDRGGTYYRYDRDTGIGYVGDANQATPELKGEIRIATQEDFDRLSGDTAVTPETLSSTNPLKLGYIDDRDETQSGIVAYVEYKTDITGDANGKTISFESSFVAEKWANGVRDDESKYYLLGQNGLKSSDGSLSINKDGKMLDLKANFPPAGTLPIATPTILGGIKIGEGLEISEDGTVTVTGGGGSSANDKYGIRGDYATHYGILEAPNGILENTRGKELVLKQGTVMKLAGNGAARTIIANDTNHTVTASQDITLFFAEGGNFVEVTDVFYSEDEPQNGETGYAAWWKPSLAKWQFKSNDTGNIWREAVATPIANIRANAELISGINYIGYRILDDEILVLKPDVEALVEGKQDKLVAQNGITVKKQPIGSYDPVNKTPFEVKGTVVKQLFTNDLYSTTKTYVIFKATGNFLITSSADIRLSDGLSFSNNKVGDYGAVNSVVVNETDCDYEGQYVMLAWENVANSQIPEVRVAPFLGTEWKVVLPASRDNGKVVKPNYYINANFYSSTVRFEELYLVNNFVEVKDVVSANIDNQLIQLNSQGELTVNMDEIGADLTTKANTDLSNLTEAGKRVIKDNAGGSTGAIVSEKYPAQLPDDGEQTTIKKLEYDAANKKIIATYDYVAMEGGIQSDSGTFTTKIPLDINTVKAGLGIQTITKVTQAQYDKLTTKDKWTLYIIVG